MNRLLTGTALGLMLAVTPALAQDTPPPQPSETPPAAAPAPQPAQPAEAAKPAEQEPQASNAQFISAQNPGDWLASNVIGQTVTNSNNESIGDINDVLVSKGGDVLGAVIGVGGFLGIGEKNVAVKWESLEVMPQPADENEPVKVKLNVTKDTLESAPAFTTQEESEDQTATGGDKDDQAMQNEKTDTPAPRD